LKDAKAASRTASSGGNDEECGKTVKAPLTALAAGRRLDGAGATDHSPASMHGPDHTDGICREIIR
jgi:hypothetical protein